MKENFNWGGYYGKILVVEFNDKENLIIMSSETYDRREKMLELYEQLVYIESERIINNKQYTID